MEPDVMPLHLSAPAPMYDDRGESVSEDDDFGEFGGFSDSTEPSPHLKQPPPAIKPAPLGPARSCNHQAEPSRPASSVTSEQTEESSTHFANGYGERAPAPREETGFADFTVFTEQAAHPWCCGFSPTGDAEQWGDGAGAGTAAAALRSALDPEREAIMDSEPRPQRALGDGGGKRGCATVKHCAESVAALVHSSQDHHHSQEAPPRPAEGEGDAEGNLRGSSDSFKTFEMQNSREAEEDHSERTVEFEDSASLFDNVSFGGPSEDFEPNVSSLGSPGDQTDAEEDDLGDDWLSDSSASRHLHRSATQGISATSLADLNNCTLEQGGNTDGAQVADGGPRILSRLPPSDSFADFCSAPAQEDGGEMWAEFREQRVEEVDEEEEEEEEEKEDTSGLQTDEEGQHGASRRRSSQASLCCRVQQLLQTTFPESGVSPAEGEETVLDLAALLHTQHLSESEVEETPPLCPRTQWVQQGFWWPHQDAHSALSLKFQWGGSHTNRILLSCLGVDTRNIVFMGAKKQPVSVPVFASSLGMLEPTKDSAPVAGSPGRAAAGAPRGSADVRGPSVDSVQEPPPSPGRSDGSSHRLSSSQDDSSVLDLDYFGPEEVSRSSSSSSSSRSNTPPPGVDRELYRLTISRVDAAFDSSRLEETWKRLMSSAERTSTSVRNPQLDAELSAEACRLIGGLPNLSFMQARVLMFPSVLLPKE